MISNNSTKQVETLSLRFVFELKIEFLCLKVAAEGLLALWHLQLGVHGGAAHPP